MPVGLDTYTNAQAVYFLDANGNPTTGGGGGGSGMSQAEFIAALKSGTANFTSVARATSSTSILAANTARKGATISNSDTQPLLVDLSGGTASATRYTYSIAAGGSLEVPFGYTGAITGIWTGTGTGAALVTEFS